MGALVRTPPPRLPHPRFETGARQTYERPGPDERAYDWSHGRSKATDLAGRRYADLMVLFRVPTPSHLPGQKHATFYLCACLCGRRKVIRSRELQNGTTKSCGCRIHRAEVTTGELTAAQRLLLQHVKDAGGRLRLADVPPVLNLRRQQVWVNATLLADRGYLEKRRMWGKSGQPVVLRLLPAGERAGA